jgi:aspartate dehydrogenase
MQFGVIGYGAVARNLIKAQAGGKLGRARLGAVLVREGKRLSEEEMAANTWPVCDRLEHFLKLPIRLVVEAAGQQALRQYAVPVLEAGKDLLVVSYGAFGDEEFYQQCLEAADRGGGRLYLCSAALTGLDGIQAVATEAISEVTHIVRKPPKAWLGTPAEQMVDLMSLTEPYLIYDGPARGAVTRFPANVNIACAVSLAGIGLDRTRLQIWADPYINVNAQEIMVIGETATLHVKAWDVPSENPKSGKITYGGIIKALRNLAGPVMIGV